MLKGRIYAEKDEKMERRIYTGKKEKKKKEMMKLHCVLRKDRRAVAAEE